MSRGSSSGRSTGTWALSTLEDEPAKRVWIAPLLQLEPVWSALQREPPHRSFVLIGTADAVFDRAKIEQLRAGGARVALVEGGDHGLDVGDAVESARRLAEALAELRAFLAE